MVDNSFFEEQKEQSLIKSTIVSKYFDVWANVIISTQKRYPQHSQKIAYIDLFAGPGRFKDGSMSTPLRIINNAIEKIDLRERLVAIFNDKDENNSNDLQQTIRGIPGVKKNYKEVLRELYEDGSIGAVSPTGKPPRKGTFSDETMVTFPS